MSLSRRALAALAAAPFAPAVNAQQAPRLFALSVGIDAYLFISPLRGAVNDARLLETVLRPIAHRSTLLINEQATRAAFIAAWEGMARDARAGDTILITFSGHGMQFPERVRGSEADGKDEALVFHAFTANRRPNSQELMVDDDIGARFAATGARGIRSIFLADACHAGTLTRSLDSRAEAPPTRTIGLQLIEADMLPPPSAPAPVGGQPNLLYLAGAQDNEQVEEVRIGNRWHGGLSHAFAHSLSRAANAGSAPSVEAFMREVLAGARARNNDGKHRPLAENQLPPNDPIIPLARSAAVLLPPVPEDTPLGLHIMPGGGPLAEAARRLPMVRIVPDRAAADAILDPARGDLVAGGDLVAAGLRAEALEGAVAKQRALRWVTARGLPAMEAGLVPRGTALAPGGTNSRDARHPFGSEWDLVLRPPGSTSLVVAAIAADGLVRLLSPNSRAEQAVQGEFRMGVRVTPPAGAAHVVAAASGTALIGLHGALARLDRQVAPWDVVRSMASAPGLQALAIFGFHAA